MEETISVVIPFYSGVEWLDEALESVLQQTLTPNEIIVINDGSKEDIDFLVEKYKGKVWFISQENKGAASARNHGIRVSSGDYIAFLDSDDLWLPEKLEKQISYMKEKHILWSHCPYKVFDDKTRKTISVIDNHDTEGLMFPRLLARCKIGTPCVILRRECIKDSDMLFNEEMRQGQDYCFWNVLAKKYELGNVGESLVLVRNHNTNIAKNVFAQLKSKSMMYNYLNKNRKYFGKIPSFLAIGFKLSHFGYGICSNISNRKVQNKISYVFYAIPWVIFHLYFKFG